MSSLDYAQQPQHAMPDARAPRSDADIKRRRVTRRGARGAFKMRVRVACQASMCAWPRCYVDAR